MLRALALTTLLCFVPSLARADEPTISVPVSLLTTSMPLPTRGELLTRAEREERSGKAMLGTGVALAVFGTALGLVGSLALSGAIDCPVCRNASGDVAATALGPLLLAVGLPLWNVGQQRARQSAQARVTLTTGGLTF